MVEAEPVAHLVRECLSLIVVWLGTTWDGSVKNHDAVEDSAVDQPRWERGISK